MDIGFLDYPANSTANYFVKMYRTMFIGHHRHFISLTYIGHFNSEILKIIVFFLDFSFYSSRPTKQRKILNQLSAVNS